MLCLQHLDRLPDPPVWSDAIEQEFVQSQSTRDGDGGRAVGIIWTNRNTFSGAQDNYFDDVFGTSTAAAQGVIDAALAAWSRVITSFNRADGTSTLQLTITMNRDTSGNFVGGFGGAGGPASAAPADGLPRTGSITLNAGTIGGTPNDSNGWFFDTTPNDYSEFQGAILNPFSGAQTPPGVGGEFYSVISAEITHCLGLISPKAGGTGSNFAGYRLISSGYVHNTGVPGMRDTAEGGGTSGYYYTFNGPSLNHLMTSYNSGDGDDDSWGNVIHTAGGTANPTYQAVNYVGTDDDGNAASGGERTLPSWVTANILKDAYGYSIENPAKFGTMMTVLNQTTGQLTIRGINNSADTVYVHPANGLLTVSVDLGNDFAGSGFRPGAGNLDAYVSEFNLGSVSSINIDTGSGNDFIILDAVGSTIPVTVSGSDGTDQLIVRGSAGYDSFTVDAPQVTGSVVNVQSFSAIESIRIDTGLGNSDIDIPDSGVVPAVTIQGDSGNELINLHRLDTATPTVFFLGSGHDTVNIQPDAGSDLVKSPVTINGGDGNDIVNVAPVSGAGTILQQPVTFNGGNDNDQMRIGSDNADSVWTDCTFNGESGTEDWLIYNDQLPAYGIDYDVRSTFVNRVGLTTRNVTYSSTDRIFINCGSGGDNVIVRNGVAPTVQAYGNNGNDNFTRGDGIIQASSVAIFEGGNGTDQITFDDHLNANNIIFDCRANEIFYGGLITQTTTGFESVGILAGTGQNEITFQGTLAQNFNVDSGAGNDNFILGFQTSVTFQGQVNLQGSFGADVFNVLLANTSGAGNVTINGGNDLNTLSINRSGTLYYTLGQGSMLLESFGGSFAFNYGNIENGSITGNSLAETFYIYSAPGSSFGSFIVAGNAGSDVFYAIQDNAGNFSFQNLVINGGADTDSFTYDATAVTSAGGVYAFAASSLYISRGILTDNIIFGAGVENITFNGGAGDDSIRVDHYNATQYATGYNLRINGGGGDDLCAMGNGDFASNILSISSLTFDGQAGTNDELRIDNAAAAGGWTYTRNNGSVGFSNGSYVIGIGDVNAERVVVNAGASNDSFDLTQAAAGVRYVVNAGGGYDDMFTAQMVAQGSYISTINGDLEYNAGAGGGRLRVWHNFGAGAHTVHLDNNSIDAYPGDDMFAGRVYFSGLTNSSGGLAGLELQCGRGADNVYLQPHPDTNVVVTGGGGTDTLNLALARAENYSVNGTPASGSVTSTNLKPLNFSQFDVGPNIDDNPPAAVNFDFDFNAGALRGTAPQRLSVQFNDNVAPFIDNSFLNLFNTTTGTQIPTGDIFLSFDPITSIATFTFDNYPGGLLPDGVYQAYITAGLVDQYGNPMTVNSDVYTFVWSAGTAAADFYRVALEPTTLDYQVFLNDDTTPAFLAGQGTAKIVLAGGAGDDALTLDATNGDPITPQGLTFDGGADIDTIHVVASTGADSVTIGAININLNISTVTHGDVEAFTYDGNGDYDTLRVKGGAPTTLVGTQRFADLVLNSNASIATQPGTNSTIVTRHVSVAAGATLDLADNDMLIDSAIGLARSRPGGPGTRSGGGNTIDEIQLLINTARNGGAWDGAGITSSSAAAADPKNTTLGAMPGADFQSIYAPGATFNGEPVTDTAVLVKYTYYGDADFNGQVNFDDYSRTDAGFNFSRSGWVNGDYDGNGVVNFDDYSLIDLAFNTQGAAL